MDDVEQAPAPLVCWICAKEALGVACSPLGAISGAYCRECLVEGREPWGVIVGALFGCERGKVADWMQPLIDRMVAFYGRTEDELWAEVAQAEREYDEACTAEPQVALCGCGLRLPFFDECIAVRNGNAKPAPDVCWGDPGCTERLASKKTEP
jgi:hypothetical protein